MFSSLHRPVSLIPVTKPFFLKAKQPIHFLHKLIDKCLRDLKVGDLQFRMRVKEILYNYPFVKGLDQEALNTTMQELLSLLIFLEDKGLLRDNESFITTKQLPKHFLTFLKGLETYTNLTQVLLEELFELNRLDELQPAIEKILSKEGELQADVLSHSKKPPLSSSSFLARSAFKPVASLPEAKSLSHLKP